jgi:hypothetical protein
MVDCVEKCHSIFAPVHISCCAVQVISINRQYSLPITAPAKSGHASLQNCNHPYIISALCIVVPAKLVG